MEKCYDNMNEIRRSYEKLLELKEELQTREDGAYEAVELALPMVRGNIKCDRCGKAKAVELSDTGFSYCKRCYKAVTDGRTPY